MRKTITAKRSKEFVKKVTAMITELGAEKVDNRYPYNLRTIAGNLKIKVDEDNNYCYSVFTKFDNPSLADEKIIGVNRYSGKWNFHISGIKEVDVVIDIIKDQMEMILIN